MSQIKSKINITADKMDATLIEIVKDTVPLSDLYATGIPV
jgi:hypothetical protein